MKAKRYAVWRAESRRDRHESRLALREFTFLNACAGSLDLREAPIP
jgi:hypothetical protein